jgi:hypothetical protein
VCVCVCVCVFECVCAYKHMHTLSHLRSRLKTPQQAHPLTFACSPSHPPMQPLAPTHFHTRRIDKYNVLRLYNKPVHTNEDVANVATGEN